MAGPRVSESNYKWWVLIIVMIGTLMAALDSSIVNVSIPAIMADFGSGIDEIEWVITSYMLAFATLMPLTAWLRDRIGHRTLYLSSLFVFTLGSVLCGMAWDLPSLIVARVIQALGGGAITPTGMAMIAEVFEPRERGKTMGLWNVGVIVGPAFGPTLGGFLTEYFGWRSIFMVNLPIGMAGLALAARVLKHDRPHPETHRPFDLAGFLFLSLFLIAFLLGLSKGEHEGWTSGYVVGCAILTIVGFAGFLLVETLIPYGIMDLSLFRSSVFSIAMVLTFVRSVALFGGVFLLPVFLQSLMGLSEIDSGLILLPGSLVIGVFMPIAGRLSDRFGSRMLSIVGLLALALFMFEYRHMDTSWTQWMVIEPTLVRGVGIGLLMAPVMATALNAVPRHKAGMASSMLNLIQQVGGSVGIAILATVLSHRMKFHFSHLASRFDPSTPAISEAMHRLMERAHVLGFNQGESLALSRSALGQTLAERASVLAFQDSFLVGAAIVAIAIVPALFLPGQAIGGGGDKDMQHLAME